MKSLSRYFRSTCFYFNFCRAPDIELQAPSPSRNHRSRRTRTMCQKLILAHIYIARVPLQTKICVHLPNTYTMARAKKAKPPPPLLRSCSCLPAALPHLPWVFSGQTLVLAEKEGGEEGQMGAQYTSANKAQKPPWAGRRFAGGGIERPSSPCCAVVKNKNKKLIRGWWSEKHGQKKTRHDGEVLLRRYYCRGQRSSSDQSENPLSLK